MPLDKEQIIHDGKIELRGWAYSGGDRWPERVEVSADGGSVWYEVPWDRMSEKYYHAWRVWSVEIPVDAEGWLELCCRTWVSLWIVAATRWRGFSNGGVLLTVVQDNALNTQPTFVRSTW